MFSSIFEHNNVIYQKFLKMCLYDRFPNENHNKEGNNLFRGRNSRNICAEHKCVYENSHMMSVIYETITVHMSLLCRATRRIFFL